MEQIFFFEFVGEWYATKGNAAFGGGGDQVSEGGQLK